ncbi:rod shape-determining protein MreD [Polaribacter sp. IC073]|uniref:rod shape-determining protein MreD n=1 Tax=Polaribacter sp. IC073 TaxID=2508540 RepID=UPI0011BEA177|nr:rod shape-determining protein MreD [Polaribacter sp. IC073]TXD46838.1 rod shape-determining protein MreD [Polaribacter sp. IC073]
MNKTIYFGLLFVFLVFLQVFVLNNMLFLGYVNPYLYIIFVFLYPLKKSRFTFLLLSFLLGLSIDFFSDSGGIHAFSILTIAYLRLFFIKVFFRKYEIDYPFFSLNLEPFGKSFNYVVTLTVIHHFILFSLINFSFQNISHVILNTLYSSVFTLVLYFLSVYIFSKKQ